MGNVEVRHRGADWRELVAEVAVEGLEVIGHLYRGGTVRVDASLAVVDVHHLGRFHERVVEVFVVGIERMVDLERASALGERAGHVGVSGEVPGIARAASPCGAVDGVADTTRARIGEAADSVVGSARIAISDAIDTDVLAFTLDPDSVEISVGVLTEHRGGIVLAWSALDAADSVRQETCT